MVVRPTKNEHVGHGEQDDVVNVTQLGKISSIPSISSEKGSEYSNKSCLLKEVITEAERTVIFFNSWRMAEIGVGNTSLAHEWTKLIHAPD